MNKQKSKNALLITQYHHFNRATDDKVNHSSHYLIYKITLGELFGGWGWGLRGDTTSFISIGKIGKPFKILKISLHKQSQIQANGGG